jgi:hypothetical protein
MNVKSAVTGCICLLLPAVFLSLTGCSGGSSGSAGTQDISNITEISSESKTIYARDGGTVTHDELTAVFPAATLPVDAQIKASKVSVPNSKQDPFLVDITDTYVISTTSSREPLELADSATIAFKIDPESFDPERAQLVVWNGYQWQEAPAQYDGTRQVVTSTVEVILPYGTRIYCANPAKQSPRPGVRKDSLTISEFVAVKVAGVTSETPTATRAVGGSAAKAKRIQTANFTVQYSQDENENQAREIGQYMENAYKVIVGEMGFRKPGQTAKIGYGKTWPVFLEEQEDSYGRADSSYYIEVQPGEESGDDLAHTCHHEFTHFVQYKTLTDAGNEPDDGMSWFDETMADAFGFYAQKGLGVIYSSADTYMGDFDIRLDADEYSMPDTNDDYEYVHFPFISYILAKYGHAGFKIFFETFYAYTPGKEKIGMTTIDTAAAAGLGKPVSGRGGIYWDFYRDYFISGSIFNKTRFMNLPNRSSGSPLEITEDNKGEQGATIVEVGPSISVQKDFTMLRLSGQVLIFRYKGASANALNLSVKVKSNPGSAVGRIQLIAFKRVDGVLQPVGTPEDVADGGQKQLMYSGFGQDIHDIYVLMTNTSSHADDYKVRVEASVSP